MFAAAVAVVALIIAGVAVAVSNRDSGGSGATGEAGGQVSTVDIVLSEFKITPNPIKVPAGTVTFNVVNQGTVAHNFVIPALGVRTKDLNGGQRESITVDVGAGTYDVLCEIAGHAAAGMTAKLEVTSSGGGGEVAGGGSTNGGGTSGELDLANLSREQLLTLTPEQNRAMDRAMEERAMRFLTEDKSEFGARVLEPTILPDGTKEWKLTAKVVDWEVEPGHVVKAWTYNGTVPGPTLKADVGDRIRIVLRNELPISTSLHLHGVRVPNELDGVDPFTQPAQEPGTEFVYEFTALQPAVGMYHSHHNAQQQIPDGMSGALIIGDYVNLPANIMQRIGATKITQEVVMNLYDSGSIGLALNGKAFPATEAYRMRLGESMVVHYYNEGLMGHPMHLHQPVGWIVAKDGFLLENPMPADTIWVSPGERYTVVYTAEDPGVWAWHCHILTHAETGEGLRWMTTAVIIQ